MEWWAERLFISWATDLKDEFDQAHVASTGGLWEETRREWFNTTDLDADSNSQLGLMLKTC